MAKVRAGSKYKYDPAPMDRIHLPVGVVEGVLKPGDTVKVVNLPGCPPANTMRMCHIADPETGRLLGLVCVGSLEKV